MPPTREQRRVADRLRETSRLHAAALGVTRRQFLASPCGMAAAFLALNTVFGRFFDVSPAEAWEAAAATERQPQSQFVFDVQTHHVAAPRQFTSVLRFREVARRWNPEIGATRDMSGSTWRTTSRRSSSTAIPRWPSSAAFPRPPTSRNGWVLDR